MSELNTYEKLKTKSKDVMFSELFKLKAEKKELDKRIKDIEDTYRPDLEGLNHDVYYELDNGLRFSIKRSTRKGSIDTKRLEADGINVDGYRKKDSTIFTVRLDK